MRLKLNRTLRAALIAAITAVGMSISQAAVLTEVASMNDLVSAATVGTATESTTWEITGSAVYDFNGSTSSFLGGISIPELNQALLGSDYVTVAAWINSTSHGTSDAGHSIFGYGEQNDGIKVIDQDGKLKMTTKHVADFATSAVGIDLNQWELVAVTFHKNGNKLDVQYMLDESYSGTVSGGYMETADNQTFAIGSGNGKTSRELFVGSIGDMTVFTSSDWATYDDVSNLMSSAPTQIVATEMTWNGTGTSDTWDTTATNWTKGGNPAAYESSVATTAVFGTEAAAKSVQLGAALKAQEVKVGDAYTFDMNGQTLSASKLTVEGDGASLALTGTGTLTASQIAATGKTINIGSGVVLSGSGTGTLVGAGTFALASGTATLGNIALGGDWTGAVRIGGFGFSGTDLSSYVNAAKTSWVEISGITGGYLKEWNAGGQCAVNIKLTNPDASTPAWIWSDGSGSGQPYMTFTGKWAGTGSFKKTGSYNQHFTLTGDISAWTGEFQFASPDHSSNLTFAGNASAVNAAITKQPGNGTLNVIVDTDAAATFSNSVTASSLTINSGKAATLKGVTTIGSLAGSGALTVDAGANTVTINGAAGLAKTITLTSGTLDLNGIINISNDMEITGGGISYSGGQHENNGFQTVEGLLQVVDIKGGTLNEGTVSYTYGGQQVATSLTNGAINVAPTTSYSIFYTKVAGTTESLAAAKAVAETHQEAINTVVMSNNTTLAADSAGSYAVSLENGASATVNASAATTISALTGPVSGQTLTLGGSAVVTITAANEFAGNVNVTGVTVVLGSVKALGAFNATKVESEMVLTGKTITVGTGATVDLNGKSDANYAFTLAGGTLTNTGSTIGHNLSQTSGLILTADSYIGGEGQNEFWLLGPGYASNKADLQGHTLTKNGTGIFGFAKTTITEGTLKIDAGTVTFSDGGSTAANIVLNGGVIGGTLNMTGDISLTTKVATDNNQAVTVTGTGKTLTMTTEGDAALTLSQGLTVTSGTVAVNGNVTISGHSLDLSSNNSSTGKVEVGSTGTLNVNNGMWLGNNSNVGILLEQGGIVNIDGLNIIGEAEDAAITATEANQQYGTANANIKITNSTVTSTGNRVTLGNTLDGVEVVVGNGSSLTLNTNAESVTVGDGGTFTLGEGKSVTNLTVQDGGTIAGGVDATKVGIAADATATFNEGISNSGVTFSADEGVQVYNKGEDTALYGGIGDDNMQVTADVLVSEAGAAVTVKNEVVVAEIVNYGEGPLTLTHVDTEALQSIGAYMDGVTLQNVGSDPIVLEDITLLGTTVAVYQGTDEVAAQEGTVTITESLFAGGSTLLANLEMADGSTLNVQGGNTMALTLGSEFTIADGALVKLDEATLEAIAGLVNIGDTVILIKQLEGSELTTNLVDGDWSRTHFDLSSITDADYKLFVQDGQIGLVKSSMAPEPTTGTLSLLALMALAARRRRK